MSSFSVLLLALTSLGCAAAVRLSSHATLELSQARSDLGAAVADGAAVFAGGCSAGSTGGGKLGGGCKDPSDVVDILRPSADNSTAAEDRLWAAAAGTAVAEVLYCRAVRRVWAGRRCRKTRLCG